MTEHRGQSGGWSQYPFFDDTGENWDAQASVQAAAEDQLATASLRGCYNDAMANTTIQITTVNRDLLDELGEYMKEKHPGFWSGRPSYNAIVGFAVSHTLEYFTERDEERGES